MTIWANGKWDDVSIYELSLNGVPVYIGSTFDLKRRLAVHKIKHDTCIVIDKCTDADRSDTEYMYIQLYKSWGFALLNVMDCKDYNRRYTIRYLEKKKQLNQGLPI